MKQTYQNCRCLRQKIDSLLQSNSSYQAHNIGIGTTPKEKEEVNRYCYEQFILPIKDLDNEFFESIS